MYFNSLEFAIFFPIAFILYWLLGRYYSSRGQNIAVVGMSMLFYGWWNPQFLLLIAGSIALDYSLGLRIAAVKHKKPLLYLSIFGNLGVLVAFKYFGFFVENIHEAFSLLGVPFRFTLIDLILPVGISFYTFQTMSYTIDIYRGKLEPTRDIWAFASFVLFFPQLVAGPIERAKHLLPQFFEMRKFSYSLAVEGLQQILWGLFKKVVIADKCAVWAQRFLDAPEGEPGGNIALSLLCFAFQIYGDFSGYSDIAIGSAKLLGIRLSQNFATPYFSSSISEFWRRWHISLSSWFRDYVYIPLGGSRRGKWLALRNVFLVFMLSGIWHGAEWTFLWWGLLHALAFIPEFILRKYIRISSFGLTFSMWPKMQTMVGGMYTFCIVCLAWVLFRSPSIEHAIEIYSRIFDSSLFVLSVPLPKQIIVTIGLLLVIEWKGRAEEFPTYWMQQRLSPVALSIWSLALIVLIYFTGQFKETVEFIYFQF